MKYVIFLILNIVLVGCSSSPLHVYQGAELPESQLVFLEVVPSENAVTEILRVDGASVNDSRMLLLPGKHEVKITFKDWYFNNEMTSSYPFVARVDRAVCSAKFSAAAGERYNVMINESGARFVHGRSRPVVVVQSQGAKQRFIKANCSVREPHLPLE